MKFANHSVGFRQEANGAWTLSNAIVRLSGRVGGTYMADEISYRGAPAVGRWGALLQWEHGGSPDWTDVTRSTDVSYAKDPATGIGTVTVRAEGTVTNMPSPIRFAFTHRLSLAPGGDEILAEIVSLENTGDTSFTVQNLFMRPFAIVPKPGEVDVVPNLWKGPIEDWWLLPDGSRWGVSSRDPGVRKASLWYRDSDATQHPDVRCMSGTPFSLAPGKSYFPSVAMGARLRLLAK